MKAGQRVWPAESLQEARRRALAEIKRMPRSLLALDHAPDYPVTVSEALLRLARQVDASQSRRPAGVAGCEAG